METTLMAAWLNDAFAAFDATILGGAACARRMRGLRAHAPVRGGELRRREGRPFESSALFLDWWRFAGAAFEDGFSFPSGHMTAASAAMAALMLAYRNWKTVLGGSIVMLVMGAARCYLVAHYPTDVLTGLLVGALAAVAAQLLVSFAFRRYGERRFARPRHACAPVRRRR